MGPCAVQKPPPTARSQGCCEVGVGCGNWTSPGRFGHGAECLWVGDYINPMLSCLCLQLTGPRYVAVYVLSLHLQALALCILILMLIKLLE